MYPTLMLTIHRWQFKSLYRGGLVLELVLVFWCLWWYVGRSLFACVRDRFAFANKTWGAGIYIFFIHFIFTLLLCLGELEVMWGRCFWVTMVQSHSKPIPALFACLASCGHAGWSQRLVAQVYWRDGEPERTVKKGRRRRGDRPPPAAFKSNSAAI